VQRLRHRVAVLFLEHENAFGKAQCVKQLRVGPMKSAR
jgi:hypothetical protein